MRRRKKKPYCSCNIQSWKQWKEPLSLSLSVFFSQTFQLIQNLILPVIRDLQFLNQAWSLSSKRVECMTRSSQTTTTLSGQGFNDVSLGNRFLYTQPFFTKPLTPKTGIQTHIMTTRLCYNFLASFESLCRWIAFPCFAIWFASIEGNFKRKYTTYFIKTQLDWHTFPFESLRKTVSGKGVRRSTSCDETPRKGPGMYSYFLKGQTIQPTTSHWVRALESCRGVVSNGRLLIDEKRRWCHDEKRDDSSGSVLTVLMVCLASRDDVLSQDIMKGWWSLDAWTMSILYDKTLEGQMDERREEKKRATQTREEDWFSADEEESSSHITCSETCTAASKSQKEEEK